ncbi:MAG: hypothetical protein K2L37_04880 [Lactobacillus sp.]|nr:hypothetical protein [Lactobacillus sp.]
MKMPSDKFKIEATYDELLFMYEGMMKILDEAPEKNTQEWMDKDGQCFELSIVLGKRDEFLKLRDTYKIES